MIEPRILVIGAGVNGSAIATSLYTNGVNVTVLARGKRYQELSTEGIVIENPLNHKRTITRVPVVDQLIPADVYDYVLVVVRKNQALDLLPLLAYNQSPCIVFMGNNLVGPEEFVKILGKERVMMGGVYAAGKRDGSLIRALVIKSVASPIGEIDGRLTPRLKRLAEVIRRGGFKVGLSENIVDTQMTHGVGVALIAAVVIKNGSDIHQLARNTDDLKLYVAARREGHCMMQSLGHQIIPHTEVLLTSFPVFIQVIATRLLLNSKMGEVGLQYHISQAPDEMQQLIVELKELVDQACIPLPAIRKVLGSQL